MGYDIVYERQFIRTKKGYVIPLVLAGSSNCFTEHFDSRGRLYQKRERDWTTLMIPCNSNISIDEEELMNKVESTLPTSYGEHFMRSGKFLDDDQFRKFMKNGIRDAKMIEELSELNFFDIYMKGYLSVYKDRNSDIENSVIIKNSDELEEFLQKADERLKQRENDERIYVHLSFRDEKAVPHPKHKKTRNMNKKKPDAFWTIKREDGYYLGRLHRGGANLSRNPEKVFKTKEAAEKYIEEYGINRRFSSGYTYKPCFIDKNKLETA